MDYKLLSKHNESCVTVTNPELASDGSNARMFFCADVVGSRRFAQNYGGYPRSDIAEINHAANEQMQMQLLSQLNDYSPSSNPNAGLTDAEIMLGHRSKYQQAPSESIAWLENQLHQRDVKRQADALKANPPKQEDGSIKQDVVVNPE